MEISFVQTSDIHFGDIVQNPEMNTFYAEKKRKDIKDAFDKIIDLINISKVKFFFICGDMLNNKYFTYSDLKTLSEKFEKLSETKIIIIPGKTDSNNSMSCYSVFDFPENVTVCSKTEGLNKLYFEQYNLCVYAAPYKSDKIALPEKIETERDRINILIAYGEIDESHKKIIKEKFHYAALGGSQNYCEIESNIVYSGSPESLNFDSSGGHGIIIGKISGGIVEKTFIPVSKSRYIEKEILIAGDYSFDKILDIISFSGDYISFARDYYRIILKGEVNTEIDMEKLKTKVSQYFKYVEFRDEYKYNIDFSKLTEENKGTIIEKYVSRMAEKQESDLDDQKSFLFGLSALLKEKVD